ncbi:MAG: hypothetical protein Q8935_09115, partial [Bacillota bacterium]|nr:hypothetical protein [Bacillota bacterium]
MRPAVDKIPPRTAIAVAAMAGSLLLQPFGGGGLNTLRTPSGGGGGIFLLKYFMPQLNNHLV